MHMYTCIRTLYRSIGAIDHLYPCCTQILTKNVKDEYTYAYIYIYIYTYICISIHTYMYIYTCVRIYKKGLQHRRKRPLPLANTFK